jgi:hypothetical protein
MSSGLRWVARCIGGIAVAKSDIQPACRYVKVANEMVMNKKMK